MSPDQPTPTPLSIRAQSPPYVTVAAFCQHLLVEREGTPSLMRLVDVVRPRGGPDEPYLAIAPVHLVVVLDSGGRPLPPLGTLLLHQPPEGPASEIYRGVLTLNKMEGSTALVLDIPMELHLRLPGTHVFLLVGEGRELARATLFAAPTRDWRSVVEPGVGLRPTGPLEAATEKTDPR